MMSVVWLISLKMVDNDRKYLIKVDMTDNNQWYLMLNNNGVLHSWYMNSEAPSYTGASD